MTALSSAETDTVSTLFAGTATVSEGGSGNSLGTSFKVLTSGTLTGLTWYQPSSSGTTAPARLYDQSGSLVASVTISAGTGTGWRTGAISVPVTAGQYFRVAVDAPGYSRLALNSTAPRVFGDLETVQHGTVNVAGTTANPVYGTNGAKPTDHFTTDFYAVGATLTVAGASPSPSPTPTPTASSTPTASPTPTPSASPTDTPTPAPTVTVTAAPAAQGMSDPMAGPHVFFAVAVILCVGLLGAIFVQLIGGGHD